MSSRSPIGRGRRAGGVPSAFDEALQALYPERHHLYVRRGGALLSEKLIPPPNGGGPHRLTKLLLKVTVQRSSGPVQVVISLENTVGDLIRAVLKMYAKEKRRPLLTETDPRRFELHYSQFSLESLKVGEKLTNLGSRDFFLCQKPPAANSLNLSCSDDANKAAQSAFPLTGFMDLLL
ncbi:uncharacterized protein At4g22758-like [Malania oleifera]|uniref:uncharacterized protein At4g22758-like n=1 Tax=Malania oleifera TaxID=397392 RepID=UPI0025AEBBE8|nr:uncharacterized protein At4g22758-like [Malania oleifera]